MKQNRYKVFISGTTPEYLAVVDTYENIAIAYFIMEDDAVEFCKTKNMSSNTITNQSKEIH